VFALVEIRKDPLKLMVGESADVHQLEIGDPDLIKRLESAPPKLVDVVTRAGFRIDEWHREFQRRLSVDDPKKADRQSRFEHASKLWREAVKLLANGNVVNAMACLYDALAWGPLKESADELGARLNAAQSARNQPRPPTEKQKALAREFEDLERKLGSAEAAIAKLTKSVRVKENIPQGAARRRVLRAVGAVKKQTDAKKGGRPGY
jgi:hypothetical protein